MTHEKKHHQAALVAFQATIRGGTVSEMAQALNALERASQALQKASAETFAARFTRRAA